MLGLTATPERMDGKTILPYFDNRIAAEIRLPEAIDRKLLCPFHYFGVSDDVDLHDIKWSRGGYDTRELSKVFTNNNARTITILKELNKYVADIEKVKGLGFCVSKEHAEYMAVQFNKADISSIALTADSKKDERDSAQSRLAKGKIKFIFTVDLYIILVGKVGLEPTAFLCHGFTVRCLHQFGALTHISPLIFE